MGREDIDGCCRCGLAGYCMIGFCRSSASEISIDALGFLIQGQRKHEEPFQHIR